MNIKKGDKVKVLLGKDRGKISSVERVFPKKNLVLVQDVNKVKRHVGKKVTGQEGTVLEIPKPIHISNVVLICPHCQKQTRARICKNCKKEII